MNESKKNRFKSLLSDLSSKEQQVSYKKSVPFVHVPCELGAQWTEFQDGEFMIWLKGFDSQMYELCLKIDRLMDKHFQQCLDSYGPDVPDVFEEKTWKDLMSESQKALDVMMW